MAPLRFRENDIEGIRARLREDVEAAIILESLNEMDFAGIQKWDIMVSEMREHERLMKARRDKLTRWLSTT